VTQNRNRLKTYDGGGTIYLKDGQNFEIELFNPLDNRVLAKISINGKQISSSGIVLNPGQRIFLERFIDDDRKFLFETYEVENTKEVKEAIQKNGKLEISFYNEYVPLITNTWIYNGSPGSFLYSGSGSITVPCTYGNIGTTTANTNATTTTLGLNSSYNLTNTSSFTGSLTSGTTSTTAANYSSHVSEPESNIETGRIEMGDKSSQDLSQTYGNFNLYSFQTSSIKILPLSVKPVEVKDLRKYCPECGTRAKKSTWKFCPSCGGSLD
jgi:hypothetical protein